MTLISCPECTAQVSDRSTSCVKCGCPLRPAATNAAALSEQQQKAVEMLGRGGKPVTVAKSTGLPMKEVMRLRSEVKGAVLSKVGMSFVLIAWALCLAAIIIGNIPLPRKAAPIVILIYYGLVAFSWLILFLDRNEVSRAAGRAPDVLLMLFLRPLYFLSRSRIVGHGTWMFGVDLLLVIGSVVLPIIAAAIR